MMVISSNLLKWNLTFKIGYKPLNHYSWSTKDPNEAPNTKKKKKVPKATVMTK